MGVKILFGLDGLALLAQLALAWVVYSAFTGEAGSDGIDAVRWGTTAIAVTFGAALAAMIGGFVLHKKGGGAAAAIGLAAIGLSVCEFIFFGFLYLIGKGNPR